jgi:tetratricopeptide (TPR) repeat protein
LAKNYRSLKQSKKAIKIYEEIVAKDSLNLVLKYQLGKLYLLNKKPKKAVDIFTYLIDNDKTNANYSYYLGLSYALGAKRDPMINSFLDTYAKDSTHLRAIARLAKSYNKLKDTDSTQLFVNKGLALNRNHIDLSKLKINYLFRDKKYKKAIPYLLNLDTIDKKDTYSASMLGKTYFKLDSLDKAKKYFTKLSRMDRENFKANTYLGHIAMLEEDYRAAFFNYFMATSIGKNKRDEEYLGLGNMYLKTDKPKQAINAYEEAFKENRRNYNALYQLAKLSDDYYKDKKIAYKLYVKYIETFYDRDTVIDAFVKRRIKDIKKDYFMKGETLK